MWVEFRGIGFGGYVQVAISYTVKHLGWSLAVTKTGQCTQVNVSPHKYREMNMCIFPFKCVCMYTPAKYTGEQSVFIWNDAWMRNHVCNSAGFMKHIPLVLLHRAAFHSAKQHSGRGSALFNSNRLSRQQKALSFFFFFCTWGRGHRGSMWSIGAFQRDDFSEANWKTAKSLFAP